MVQLYPFLPGIIDAMVRALDPNTPEARAALLPLATVNFAELVRNYPNVAFHSPSQRLAVGTMDGIVIIYDLRIAARILILEV
jgi:WD40 repeat protein